MVHPYHPFLPIQQSVSTTKRGRINAARAATPLHYPPLTQLLPQLFLTLKLLLSLPQMTLQKIHVQDMSVPDKGRRRVPRLPTDPEASIDSGGIQLLNSL